MSVSRFLFVVASTVAAASIARAQTAEPSSLPALTIARAVDEALQRNLALLAERSNLSIAEAAMISARLRPNPVTSFSADHLDVLGTGFDQINNGGPPEVALRVDLPIERGGKREARIAVASVGRSIAEARFASSARAWSAPSSIWLPPPRGFEP
jgi:cobalt-zinc-cadmium efflux system outer membrane protein